MKDAFTHPSRAYQLAPAGALCRALRSVAWATAVFLACARPPEPPTPAEPAAARETLGPSETAAPSPASDTASLALEIEQPAPDARVGPSACGVLVAGRAGPPELDLVVALDTSVSTAAASGADVDRDGQRGASVPGRIGFTVGEMSTDPEDSILAAEVEATRRLVRALDFRRTRAALVTFSGGPADLTRPAPVLPDAITRVPLSDDPDAIRAGLEGLLRETPAGGTHMGAGIDQATIELLGLAGARSLADPTRSRAAIVMSDGAPTLPYGPNRPADNVRAVVAAADRAKKARVRVSAVAFGPDALALPVAAVEIAERTGGRFIPIRDGEALLEAMNEADLFAGVTVSLRNETLGEAAEAFRMTPDGSFAGFVRLAAGENRIAVDARSEDGGVARAELRVVLDAAAQADAVPREYDFLSRSDATPGAFETCLRQARRIDLTAEDLRREQIRRQLVLELERERARALERAAEQRKELELEPAR